MSRATNRSVIWLVNILFIVWILPLGAFIKPEQESEACNGRRAICLCSHLLGKALDKQLGKVLLKQYAGGLQKENASSSPDFVLPRIVKNSDSRMIRFQDLNEDIHSFLYIASVEPVPRIG